MKRILITAGGTATAWHIIKNILTYYDKEFSIYICDTNPRELVPAAQYSEKFFQVPAINDGIYMNVMLDIIINEHIDIIVPLIDMDLKLFSCNNIDLRELGVKSTGPSLSVFLKLADKKNMYDTLTQLELPVIPIHNVSELEDNKKYIIKPRLGFGSKGIRCVTGYEAKKENNSDYIIQEYCEKNEDLYEVTAEVFNYDGNRKIFCRQRLETKSGVCTKAKMIESPEIEGYINRLMDFIELPTVSCIQFMKYNNFWCANDCNLRLGAGTALSSKYGFQMTRAWLATLLQMDVVDKWLVPDINIRTVLRVYDEIAVY